jgi:hypothetical protein
MGLFLEEVAGASSVYIAVMPPSTNSSVPVT